MAFLHVEPAPRRSVRPTTGQVLQVNGSTVAGG